MLLLTQPHHDFQIYVSLAQDMLIPGGSGTFIAKGVMIHDTLPNVTWKPVP